MKSTVTSDGELIVRCSVAELAAMRAYVRKLTGKPRPTMADVKKMTLAAHLAFCPRGRRYPNANKANRVTIVIS